MNASAVGMLVFGAVLLWGGLALTITIALIKSKKS